MITNINKYKISLINENKSSMIHDLTTKHDEQLSSIYAELGIFYAFSKAQFDEKKVEGVTYLRGASGMLIPKGNEDQYTSKMKEHFSNVKSDFQNTIDVNDYIKYELANHEAYYTGDWIDVLPMVQDYYPTVTEEDIYSVYKANVHLYD